MNNEIEEQLIRLLSAVRGRALTHLLAGRYLKEEEHRGLEGDIKEALLKTGATVMATTLVSAALVRPPW